MFDIIRVFPRKTKWTPDDEFAFIGDPPLFRPPEMPVKISVTFTWDIEEGKKLQRAWGQYYRDVQIGGPAFDDKGNGFVPGRFVKVGVIETSRGCPKKCPWCFVPEREGKLREIPITQGNIIIDNNLLACSQFHLVQVFKMLKKQKRGAEFKGGLDASLFNSFHNELLHSIHVNEMFFACDTTGAIKPLEKVANMINDFPYYKKRCFVMIGRTSFEECEKRLKRVFELGFDPFAQLYQPKERIKYSKEWGDLNRKWSRPAAYRSKNCRILK